MDQELLLTALAQEARAQRDARLADARREADAHVEQTKRACAQRHAEALEAAQAAAQQEVTDTRQRAQAEAERRALVFEETVAEEILHGVAKSLASMADDPSFSGVLDALLGETLAQTPQGARLFAPPAHVAHCRQWLDGRERRDVEVVADEALADGVAVEDKARTFRITNTLSSRFKRVRNEARRLCLSILFGEGG